MNFYRFHYYSTDFYILSVSALSATTLHSVIKSLAKLYLYSHDYIHYFDALSSATITPLKKALSSMSGTNSRIDDRAFFLFIHMLLISSLIFLTIVLQLGYNVAFLDAAAMNHLAEQSFRWQQAHTKGAGYHTGVIGFANLAYL